ncbi:hypothetical protein F4860DRAFT_454956 [Xylaria cubensis]|nr:hypothetical protein F4860DRAFT_454956 [Xylaria cubensis]
MLLLLDNRSLADNYLWLPVTLFSPIRARLAQSVERETLNLKVAGSTPASGSIPDASHIRWE